MHPAVFPQPEFAAYSLLDSGEGEKLERFGERVVRRPDPQALWRRRLDEAQWNAADLAFERDASSGGKKGRWRARDGRTLDDPGAVSWKVAWREATCVVKPTSFKHLGLFPEQAANWDWLGANARALGDAPRLLNLFAYTGLASIVAVQAGYAVTHVDASRTSLAWARENAVASGLAQDAMRVVLDDALVFTRREVRRGSRYAGILLDPPHHGRGPKGETWQLEEHLAPLIEACGALLAPRAFLVLSTYAVGASPLAFENLLAELGRGEVGAGELALTEEGPGGRRLPCGFCARFRRGIDT